MKFARYDALIVQGAATKPIYIYINGSQVEIRDAGALWGKSTSETMDMLKASLGKKTRVLATGPAGENLVRFATLLADEDSTGTGGFASVTGSKKLSPVMPWNGWLPCVRIFPTKGNK